MRRDYHRNTPTVDSFPKRLTSIGIFTMFLMALILVRLFGKAVLDHSVTIAKAEQQYTVRRPVDPRRGNIYATDAEIQKASPPDSTAALKPLAANQRTYDLSVVPHNLKDKRAVADALSPFVNMSANDLYAKINNDKLYLPPLVKGLTEDQKTQIAAMNLSGAYLTEEDTRFYPEGSLGSQILGFLNHQDQPSYGLEQKYDEDLRGSGGEQVAERDVQGRLLSSQEDSPVRDGSSIVLTIDPNVQNFVESTLKTAMDSFQADSATAVVEDVKTGEIVAMASEPDFDPNNYGAVSKDELNRYINQAVSASWEPGSIMKCVTMAAAIDQGLIEPDTAGDFPAFVKVGSATIHTAENKAFGHETMTQALDNSDNVALVWVADKLGNTNFYNYLKKFGFGQKTGIDLPNESKGSLLALDQWRDITRATNSFGQGISVTPLQMTEALGAIANNGTMMQPHLVRQIIGADGTIVKEVKPEVRQSNIISAATSAKVTGMMVDVVKNGLGKRAGVPGYLVAGKTGTAQVPDPTGGYYADRHVGGFGGFFPADNPRFAMVLKLDNPKTVNFAESSAAPTFGTITQFLLNYYQIPPTQEVAQ